MISGVVVTCVLADAENAHFGSERMPRPAPLAAFYGRVGALPE